MRVRSLVGRLLERGLWRVVRAGRRRLVKRRRLLGSLEEVLLCRLRLRARRCSWVEGRLKMLGRLQGLRRGLLGRARVRCRELLLWRLVLLWRHEEAQLRMLVLRLRGLHVVRVHRRMRLRSLEVRWLRRRWCIREGAWGMRRMRLGRL